MFLSHVSRSLLSLRGGLAIASVVLFLAAQPTAAQQYQRLPVIAKGYQVAQITQQNLHTARRTVERPRPSTPVTYEVVPEPESALPRVVTFRGPDGEVRTFVLEGSIRTAAPRQAVVRLTSK